MCGCEFCPSMLELYLCMCVFPFLFSCNLPSSKLNPKPSLRGGNHVQTISNVSCKIPTNCEELKHSRSWLWQRSGFQSVSRFERLALSWLQSWIQMQWCRLPEPCLPRESIATLVTMRVAYVSYYCISEMSFFSMGNGCPWHIDNQAPPLAAKVHGSDTSTMMQWSTSLEDWSCVYFLQEMSKEFEACMRPLPPRLTSRALGTKHWKHWTSCLRSLWFGLWDQASQRPARWFLQTSWIHWIQCRSGFHCLWHVGAIIDNSCFCEASRPAFDQCVREVERPSWNLKSSQHIYLQSIVCNQEIVTRETCSCKCAAILRNYFPASQSIYDYAFNFEKADFAPWDEKLPNPFKPAVSGLNCLQVQESLKDGVNFCISEKIQKNGDVLFLHPHVPGILPRKTHLFTRLWCLPQTPSDSCPNILRGWWFASLWKAESREVVGSFHWHSLQDFLKLSTCRKYVHFEAAQHQAFPQPSRGLHWHWKDNRSSRGSERFHLIHSCSGSCVSHNGLYLALLTPSIAILKCVSVFVSVCDAARVLMNL